MNPKSFEVDKGKHAVVVSYTKHDDATESDEERTEKNFQRPRPKLILELATLALAIKDYWKLGDLKLKVTKISFAENKDGHFAKFSLVSTDDENPLKIGPLKIKRELDLMPGTDDRNEDSLKNPIIDSVDTLENLIIAYLGGEREQPELPPVKEDAAAKVPGLFGRAGQAIKNAVPRRRKAVAPAGEAAGAAAAAPA